MRRLWIWGLASAIAMVLTVHHGAHERALAAEKKEVFEETVLWNRQGETLFFKFRKGERLWETWGDLTDRTRIVGEKGQSLEAGGVQTGSLWKLTLQYRKAEGKNPVILEMRRIKAAPLR